MDEHFRLSYQMLSRSAHPTAMGILLVPPNYKAEVLVRSRRCKLSSCASTTMLSQLFRRSSTIRRNSFGYRPTCLFATRTSFPCKVCFSECRSLSGPNQDSMFLLGPFDAAPGSTPHRFERVCMASHASNQSASIHSSLLGAKTCPLCGQRRLNDSCTQCWSDVCCGASSHSKIKIPDRGLSAC